MAVNLQKGGRVNLTKEAGFVKGMIGLGWDTNRYQGSAEFDLDSQGLSLGTAATVSYALDFLGDGFTPPPRKPAAGGLEQMKKQL